MKTSLCSLLAFTAVTSAFPSPFTPRLPDEGYGVGTITWCFASALPKEATGVIELCYVEEGSAEQVLGRVDVRPFQSSEAKMPDLRILFTKAEVDGKRKVVLLVGYGIRSGVFVVDVPGLTTHSLTGAGTPEADKSGVFTLLGWGDGSVMIKRDGMEGVRGRLLLRYTGKT